MFDMENHELIAKFINERKPESYVAPLYIKMYNERYDLCEITQIDNFTPSGCKIGFGAHFSLIDKYSFPDNMLRAFEPVEAFTTFDEERNLSDRYIIIETGIVDLSIDSETGTFADKQSDGTVVEITQRVVYNKAVLEQMEYYQNMLLDFLSKQQEEIRKKRLAAAMSEYAS